MDYFISPDGGINTVKLAYHIKVTLTGVAFAFANQLMGAATEREIIINSNRTEEDSEATLEIASKSKICYMPSQKPIILRIVCRNEEMKIRMTMKQFLSEAKEYPELIQCHRAYTINLHYVSYYEGTSRKGTGRQMSQYKPFICKILSLFRTVHHKISLFSAGRLIPRSR